MRYDNLSRFHDVSKSNHSRKTFTILPLKEIEMTTQDLSAEQAIHELRDLVESIDLAMLFTELSTQPF